MNWEYILRDLEILETRIDKKMDHLISLNLNPFPMVRLKNGKKLKAICKGIKLLIQNDMEDEANLLLDILEEKGAKIRNQ